MKRRKITDFFGSTSVPTNSRSMLESGSSLQELTANENVSSISTSKELPESQNI